jgi:hypothetical protein
MTFAEVKRTVDLFARDVMPRLPMSELAKTAP